MTSASKAAASHRLNQAVRRNRAFSSEGLLEIMFTWAFKGLVYPQIWEDPEVDLEALALTPQCHVVAIASGGCNVLSYLIADPGRITAVDLSRAHVALNRLKLAAARHLPSWQSFYRFFGEADEAANVAAYWRFLKDRLDDETRAYWEGRALSGFGRRRISMFSRNLYRYGLLGYSIGLGHLVARAYGVELNKVLLARSLEEQRAFFETYAGAAVRQAVRALGQPRGNCRCTASAFRRRNTRRLAIGRAEHGDGAARARREAVLRVQHRRQLLRLAGVRALLFRRRLRPAAALSRARRISMPSATAPTASRCSTARSPNTSRAGRPQSLDRYVLLDAQDWMSDAQLNDLWREITRTARPGARVIFRTAAEPSLLPGRVDEPVLAQWRYEAEVSRDLTRRDRSAIYGGFHLYVLGA